VQWRPSLALHPTLWALYARRRGRRIVRYVSDGVAEQLQGAVQNGRPLRELIVEAGERYLCAPRGHRRR